MDSRFGRAEWILLVDTESGEFEALNNSESVDLSRGAGIQTAERVATGGAEVIITGHCGPNAFRTLEAAGVKVVVGASGTVAEALESFKAGSLTTVSAPDVEGHWV